MLVPSFTLAGKELGAVAAINWQPARALGGNAWAAGQQWGRSIVWSPRVLWPLVAAVCCLLLHDLVTWICSLAVGMAGAGAGASLSAMWAAVRRRARRQERPAEFPQFRLIWGALTGQSAAWCARVETRPCGRATTGVAREAVEAEGVVCSLRLDSARPRNRIPCARITVGGMDSQWGVRPACVYSLWLPTGQAQGRAVIPMHPPHTHIVSVHGSDRYMVYLVLPQIISRRRSAVKTAFFEAS